MIKDIEIAYKKLYLKNKKLDSPILKEDKELLFDKVVEELLMERIAKRKKENPNFSDEKAFKFYNDVKKEMVKWKKEVDANPEAVLTLKEKKWWNFGSTNIETIITDHKKVLKGNITFQEE